LKPRSSVLRSAAEDLFEQAILGIGAEGQYLREFRYSDETKHRADFAFPKWRILVEIDGNIYVKGGHSSGGGIMRDITKTNLAATNGWTLLRFSTQMVNNDMDGCIATLIATMEVNESRIRSLPSKQATL